jgi:hypothetical protein
LVNRQRGPRDPHRFTDHKRQHVVHLLGEGQSIRQAALPKRVPVKAVLDETEIVRLSPEAKHLTDTLWMVAYRAETALVRCLLPHYVRTWDEGRGLLREMLLASADILPEAGDQRWRVRLCSLANPRSNELLAKLCEALNALPLRYPGTDLTLVYQARGVAWILKPMSGVLKLPRSWVCWLVLSFVQH